MKKRILFLGAGPLTLPAIHHARELGWETITADYLPENPGHKLADRWRQISTVDAPAILDLARTEMVEAVIGYASEVSALTAAQVADALGLPGPGHGPAHLLSCKDRFRAWSRDEGLQKIEFGAFGADEAEEAASWASALGRPVVVKPVDNSGSRGVSIGPGRSEFQAAFTAALAASRSGRVIIEEKLERRGPQICGDGFVENGRLVFAGFGDNQAVATPGSAAIFIETYPSIHPAEVLASVRERLAAIVAASGFRLGPINFDAIILPDGTPHIFEIGIRSGGNLIPQAIGLRAGIDLVAAAVNAAMDAGCHFPRLAGESDRYVTTYVLHSRVPGVLKRVHLSSEIEPHLKVWAPFRHPGEPVCAFRSASDTVGVVLLTFDTREEMLAISRRLPELCRIELL